MDSEFPFSLADIRERCGEGLYPDSFVVHNGAAWWLRRVESGKRLEILARPEAPMLSNFHGESQASAAGYALMQCPTDHENARALRFALPWLHPVTLGWTTSAGFGDRLGLATPGHVGALQSVLRDDPGHTIVPIFAQQSIREMERTRRSPADVLDDATWGTFQGGWRAEVGADADHLKTTGDIDACAAAGYTFYTIDPGDYVDSEADEALPADVRRKVAALPWQTLESSEADLTRQYIGQTVHLEGEDVLLDEPSVMRAAAKYARAIAHAVALARHLAAKGIPSELEISVDEAETPTSPVEHIYFVGELKRFGVQWVSLAPRFPGRFEKGIDYVGDLQTLSQSLKTHAAIARALGPYKLSLHSGSDKFSVYPLIRAATKGLVHLKTAGTSFVEALRVVAQVEPTLFRQISAFARERYPEDRASYHVSAELNRIPALTDISDEDLPSLLDDRDARQVLHVTFGSLLAQFGSQILATLTAYEEAYDEVLKRHFRHHLEPFV